MRWQRLSGPSCGPELCGSNPFSCCVFGLFMCLSLAILVYSRRALLVFVWRKW
jgi:hypothetical protein